MSSDSAYIEKELLQRIARGDQVAFTEMLNRYWNNVYAQAMAYCKSSALAKDIVQDIFIKVWMKRETLADIKSFEDYLYIMARNRIISELRKKLVTPIEDVLSQTLKDDTWLPDRQLSLKLSRELVYRAIDLMPEQRKTVFRLSRYEGLSYEQIAETLGISKNTVKEHIVKALNFLRTYIYTHSDILLLVTLLGYYV